LAKIAVELEQAIAQRRALGAPGSADARVLAKGKNWQVADVVCTSGPQDRRFEERHNDVSIAVVLAGTFQYRASANGSKSRNELMTPGSLMLGSAGQCFECGHEHGMGDRCVSFWYSTEYFKEIASSAGIKNPKAMFPALRVPALREFSPLIASAALGIGGTSSTLMWEELSLKLAVLTTQLVNGVRAWPEALPSDRARVSRVLRTIETSPGHDWTLAGMSQQARLSPHHFLRIFEAVAGVTPHQFVLRQRLREAAIRLMATPEKILEVALDCGFGDVSNFNRAFRKEFGANPRAYRGRSLAAR